MGFGAVGLVMLSIVLLFYLRMISERSAKRRHSSKISAILAQADIFESAANDQAALKAIDEGLREHPDQPELLKRRQTLQKRLDEQDHEPN